MQCFYDSEQHMEQKSQSLEKKNKFFLDFGKETIPLTEKKIIRIIDNYYIEFLYHYSIFGFLNDHIIFIQTSKDDYEDFIILDLDSNKILYQKDINININFICVLSEKLILLISNNNKQILLLDYNQKKLSTKTFPKEFRFFTVNRLDENTVIMTNSETIYVYTVSSHHFSYFVYKDKIKNEVNEEYRRNMYIISKEVILIWTSHKWIHTLNFVTQKILSKHFFEDEEKLAFIDTRSGIIYNEKELLYVDKKYIKIFVFNCHFNHCDLFDYPCLDVLKKISSTNRSFYVFWIPNSTCLCRTDNRSVEFFDYILKEKIGYYPGFFYPNNIKASSKYILTDFGGFKIYRNRL